MSSGGGSEERSGEIQGKFWRQVDELDLGREGVLWELPGLWLSDRVHESPLAVMEELARVGMNREEIS